MTTQKEGIVEIVTYYTLQHILMLFLNVCQDIWNASAYCNTLILRHPTFPPRLEGQN